VDFHAYRIPFEESQEQTRKSAEEEKMSFEAPAQSDIALYVYWSMRVIGQTIEHGGFLSESVFIPVLVWTQFNAKITGLNPKLQAYQSVTSILNERLSRMHK